MTKSKTENWQRNSHYMSKNPDLKKKWKILDCLYIFNYRLTVSCSIKHGCIHSLGTEDDTHGRRHYPCLCTQWQQWRRQNQNRYFACRGPVSRPGGIPQRRGLILGSNNMLMDSWRYSWIFSHEDRSSDVSKDLLTC